MCIADRVSSTRFSRRSLLQFGGASLTAMALTGCSAQYKLRYRLTVVVDGPYGEQVGSGVYGLKLGHTSTFPNPGGMSYDVVSGDAFPVQLGNGKSVFVLLCGHNGGRAFGDLEDLEGWVGARYLTMTYGDGSSWENGRDKTWEHLETIHEGDPIEIPITEMPAIAYFGDPLQPDTGVILAPQDLSSVGGVGCSVKRCEMRLTSAPITRGIDKYLPWAPGAVPRGNFAQPRFSEHQEWFTH